MEESNDRPICEACKYPARGDDNTVPYESHIELLDGQFDRGAWGIGSDYILKERDDDSRTSPSLETATLQYLKDHTTIPVPVVVKDWIDSAGTYFTLQERVPGISLEDAWYKGMLSQNEKEQIADEVVGCLAQLRQHQSSKIEGVDGRPCSVGWLCIRIEGSQQIQTDSDDALFEMMTSDFNLPDRARDNLRKSLPPCKPYTLTGANTSLNNFLVSSGHLTGIISWEMAGYFPTWWEYVRAGLGHGAEDTEWKGMLRKRMEQFPEAEEFFKDMYALGEELFRDRWEGMDERREALMRRLMEEEGQSQAGSAVGGLGSLVDRVQERQEQS